MAKKKKNDSPGELLVATNPQAGRDWDIENTFEAGMVLTGSEVKSMRAKHVNLEGAYASFERDELYLRNMNVRPYEKAGAFGHEPKAKRKLLLHAAEIEKLRGRLTVRGYSLIPVRVYFKNGWAKVELGLAKGRDKGDKRDQLRKKTELKEARAAVRDASGKR